MRSLLAFFVLGWGSVQAQQTGAFPTGAVDDSVLTIDRIYASDEFTSKSVDTKWLPEVTGENASYTVIESFEDADSGGGKDSGEGKDIVQYDALTGERSLFVDANSLVPAGTSAPLSIDDYQVSKDRGRVLIFTNSVRVWRRNTRGDYWVFDRGTGQLYQLGEKRSPASMMYAKFSPDGNFVAFVGDGNLYLEDLLDRSVRPLLRRKNENSILGATDWVYEEEFQLRDAFHWSPDSREIAFWHFDTSNVQEFTMINNTDSLYPTVKTFGYPKAGTRNSVVRIGVIQVDENNVRWVDLPGAPQETYIPRIQWLEHSGDLLVRQMNRLQNEERLYRVAKETLETTLIHTETDDAWIDLQDTLHVSEDGSGLVYLSDRSGWRGLYHIGMTADRFNEVGVGKYDVVDVVALTQTNLFFVASPESATERFLYRIDLGNLSMHRVTPSAAKGVHEYDISPDGRFAVHRFSTTETPTVTELVSLPDHQSLRTLESNQKLAVAFAKLNRQPTEFFKVDIGSVQLDAMCIKPPDLDPNLKYPLLIYVYGEPAGSTAVNRFAGNTGLWHQMLAQQGYVVVTIDNRGTDVPRGREFRKSVYRQVGTLGPNDQAAAVKKLLSERTYLDADRVGVWGWSGGGTSSLHGIFRFPELYKTAVAVAPVANLRYYDTIYEERYMGLPSGNVDGYRNGSAIHFADQLKGSLLVVHGTADDNVHYQATELLINELVAKNKPFEMFIYPGRTHSIKERKNTRRHLMNTITRFLKRTL